MTDTDRNKSGDPKKAAPAEEDKAEAPKKTEEVKKEPHQTAEKPAEPKEKKAAKPEKSVKEKKEVKVSPKLKKLIEEVENLSVVELADLVHALEERFGVTAAAPAVAAAAPAAGSASGGEGAATEQTTFNVILAESGANKISVIKVVKELVPDLGLKEAKDLVESTPQEVLVGVNKEKAEEAKKKLEDAGAKVEFK